MLPFLKATQEKKAHMYRQLRNPHFYVLIAIDALLFTGSLYLAYAIRFSLSIPANQLESILRILPWCIAVKLVTFWALGAYRGMWRYTSLTDMQRLLEASFLSSLLIIAGISIATRFRGFPRSVFIADSIFTFFFCGGIRAAIRLFHTPNQRIAGLHLPSRLSNTHRTRLLLIGAGDAADKIIREVQGNPRSRYQIICCLDDDATKHHRSILGAPIQGPIEKLTHFARKFEAHEILICMPSISGSRMREIVALCEASGFPFRTVPSLTSLIDGNLTIDSLRPVNFEDLLGRPPVDLDTEMIGQYLSGKVVAVTGAGGSIGSELCRQIIRFSPESLILIECSEFNLYNLEMELRIKMGVQNIVPIMGHVQDRTFLERVFARHRPQVVFHAAACKHVPMVELNPWQGIANNIFGSHTMMEVADTYGVERFVLISTDKAVRPTNVMGASKRAAEVLLQSRAPSSTRFMAVRFGNVVGSSGSAIPLFQSQIKAGGPVTVTHPDITRYFMTVPEACQLVLQAGALGEGGEIFILEMGTPVRIADMARDLIRLSGKEPDVDILLQFTGLRPGEKLYEELITEGEGIVKTSHEKIMVLRNAKRPAQREKVLAALEALVQSDVYDVARTKAILRDLIPEYVPSEVASVLCESPPAPAPAEPAPAIRLIPPEGDSLDACTAVS